MFYNSLGYNFTLLNFTDMENNKECYMANFKPTNRHFKRLMESEAKHLDRILRVPEKQFVRDLFKEDSPYPYPVLYQFYHGRFKQALKVALATVKPKYITVNPKYFYEMYAQSKPTVKVGWWKRFINLFKRKVNA